MTDSSVTYKSAMTRLDEILEGIDRSEVPVDELATQVVEAAGLLKTCKKILTQTEAKVHEVLEELNTEFKEEEGE